MENVAFARFYCESRDLEKQRKQGTLLNLHYCARPPEGALSKAGCSVQRGNSAPFCIDIEVLTFHLCKSCFSFKHKS